jgi:hypothetical protein
VKQFAAILVSGVVVTGFVVVSVFGVIHGLQDNPTLNTLCGGLSTMAALVVNYWLGSSQSSSDKTDVIASLAHKALDKAPPRPGDNVAVEIQSPS